MRDKDDERLKTARRERLRYWIDTDKHSMGDVEAWCKHYSQFLQPGEQPLTGSYIRQVAPKAGKATRGIGEKAARKLERVGSKPKGWLDMLSSPAEDKLTPAPEPLGIVPIISWVAAGDYMEATDPNAVGFADEWIETRVKVNRHTFALRVDGDSMMPDFMPGMILVVEPEMEALPGDYVIAKNGDNEATFKQLVKDGGTFYLKPLNDRYPIMPLGDAQIIGVVREAVRKLR